MTSYLQNRKRKFQTTVLTSIEMLSRWDCLFYWFFFPHILLGGLSPFLRSNPSSVLAAVNMGEQKSQAEFHLTTGPHDTTQGKPRLSRVQWIAKRVRRRVCDGKHANQIAAGIIERGCLSGGSLVSLGQGESRIGINAPKFCLYSSQGYPEIGIKKIW